MTTLPGTRGFHDFTPISECVMAAKRVSEDERYAIQYDLVKGVKDNGELHLVEPKLSDFVVCMYDQKHWIGIVDTVDKDHNDVQVKFMHPCYPARSYSWPHKDDVCYVPNVNILCVISAPATITARQYSLSEKDIGIFKQALAR